MNTREKLIELLEEAEGLVNNDVPSLEQIADHLIANGVTILCVPKSNKINVKLPKGIVVQSYGGKWIPVTERLPEKDGRYLVYDCDTCNYYDSYFDETEGEFGEWQNCFDPHTLGLIDCEWNSCPNVTHWMPLPEPPKGE